MENAREGENKALIEAMERLGKVETVATGVDDDGNERPIVVARPDGKTIESLKAYYDEYNDRPERKAGTSTLTTLESFCEFVNRHKQLKSIVFLDDTEPKSPQFRAVFDAHAGNPPEGPDGARTPGLGAPDWEGHRAVYPLPMSDEWKAWTNLPKEFDQRAFALFLEDRILDVLSPEEAEGSAVVSDFALQLGAEIAAPARLMELARGLTVHLDGKVTNSVNTGSGEATLVFEERHKDQGGQQLKVPGAFAIGIPVFRGGERYPIPVRLRYRVVRPEGGDGKVYWQLAAQRLDKVLEAALKDAQEVVAAATKLPVFRGAPG